LETNKKLAEEYRNRFAKLVAYRNRVWEILIAAYFQKFIGESDSILELGSGWGEFIRNVKAGKKYAMDLNPDAQARAGADVSFHLQDCSQNWPIEPGSLDVIFTSNFFEHLPSKDALHLTLGHAYESLKPGGKLICLGPNIRFLSDLYWDFWDHHIALSDRSLSEGLTLAGFEVESCIAKFLPYSMSVGWRPPLWTVHLYIRFPIFWRIFGKQFLIVARKPG